RGSDAMSLRLYELLLCTSVGIAVRQGTTIRASRGAVEPLGLEDSEGLLPVGSRSFHGYRLLHEYFAFPNRFLFAQLTGLRDCVKQCSAQEIEIVVALDRHDPAIEAAIGLDHVSLFCTPAINLFPKKADRIHLSDRDHEYHVLA